MVFAVSLSPDFFAHLGLAEACRRQVGGRMGAPPMIDDTEKIGQADPGRQIKPE
jgi:hypothetical protein